MWWTSAVMYTFLCCCLFWKKREQFLLVINVCQELLLIYRDFCSSSPASFMATILSGHHPYPRSWAISLPSTNMPLIFFWRSQLSVYQFHSMSNHFWSWCFLMDKGSRAFEVVQQHLIEQHEKMTTSLGYVISSRLVSSRLVSSRLVSSRLVSSRLVSSRLVSSRLVSSRLVSSRLVSSRLVSSRLVSSRLVSSRLISSYRNQHGTNTSHW